jgi:hypothetical protein
VVALAAATLEGEVQAAAASCWIQCTLVAGHMTPSAKMNKREIIEP